MEKTIFVIVVISIIGIAFFHITHKTVVVCGQFKNGQMEVSTRYENCYIDSTGAEEVRTLPEADIKLEDNLLELVYEDGEIKKEYTFAQVRENTKRVFEQHTGWVDRDVH